MTFQVVETGNMKLILPTYFYHLTFQIHKIEANKAQVMVSLTHSYVQY